MIAQEEPRLPRVCSVRPRVPIGASITDEELSAAVETRSAGGETVVVASLVSRHFDFLDGLVSGTLQKDDGRSIGRALHTA